jgi:hypothetical protein
VRATPRDERHSSMRSPTDYACCRGCASSGYRAWLTSRCWATACESAFRPRGTGKRVTGAGPHTASGKAQEERKVQRELVREAFFEVKENAAPGVDGLGWGNYEAESGTQPWLTR